MVKKIKVYGASKLSEAPRWRDLEALHPTFQLVSRWPFEHVGTVPDTAEYAKIFWKEDEEDVRKADVLIVLPSESPDHPLRGALVEAGMAIALGIPVIVIGNCPCYGTWQWHLGVYHASDLDDAVTVAHTLIV